MHEPDRTPHGLMMSSPIGVLWIASDGRCITQLVFDPAEALPSYPTPLLREAERQLHAYFTGHLRSFELPLAGYGTPFQRSVWQAVAAIPWGATLSYRALAERIGASTGARAVGAANGANPLPILVPCHRVVGRSGELTGYVGGLGRKQWLLRHEGAIAAGLFDGPQ